VHFSTAIALFLRPAARRYYAFFLESGAQRDFSPNSYQQHAHFHGDFLAQGHGRRRQLSRIGDGGQGDLGRVTRFFTDEQGATLIEYALITGLIALASVRALEIPTIMGQLFSKISGHASRMNP
jgi:Flp pilus assembly pilin Flp